MEWPVYVQHLFEIVKGKKEIPNLEGRGGFLCEYEVRLSGFLQRLTGKFINLEIFMTGDRK